MPKKKIRKTTWWVVLAAAYFLLGKFGLEFAGLHPSATLVWPPAGLALASLLLLGSRVWPGIFLGAFLVNITTAGNLFTSAGIAAGNTLEALAGAFFVFRFAQGKQVFERPINVFKYAVFVGLISTLISPLVGVTLLTLGGFSNLRLYLDIWLTWWLGDMAGVLVVAPLLITAFTKRQIRFNRQKTLEFIALLLFTVFMGLVVFSDWYFPVQPLAFLCVPPLIWAAVRFSQREAAFTAFVLSSMAVWGTWSGFGPFVEASRNESLIFLQVFMGVNTMMAIVLSALVAEEKRSQAALRQKDREFVDFVENAALGVHWVDADGKILWANRAELELLGYKPNEYIGRSIDVFHTDQENAQAILARLKNHENLAGHEASLRCKDGSIKHVLISSNALREDDRFVHTRCITQDITRKKEEQEEMAETAHKLEQMVKERTRELEEANKTLQNEIQEREWAEVHLSEAQKLAKIGNWEWDIPSNMMMWSDELHRIFGVSSSEFEGTLEGTLNRFHKEDAEFVRKKFETAYRDNAPFQFKARIVCPDQSEKVLDIQGRVEVDKSDQTKKMLGICQDITERDRLLESQLLLAEIVESSEDAIISLTLDGTITSWNQGAERLYGWTKAEAVGQHVSFLFPSNHYTEFFEVLLKVKNNEPLPSYEAVRLTKTGGRVDVSIAISPIRNSLGKLIGIAKIARDITNRKELEKAVVEATDVERQRIGRDLHDGIGQQLLGIGFLANVLKSNLKSKGHVKEEKDAALIEDHVNQTLSQTRTLAREIYLAEVEKKDLPTALKQLISQMESASPMHCAFECDSPVSIEDPAVRSALYRISQEALANALKHSRGEKITVSLNQKEDKVVLVVQDDGVGLRNGARPHDGTGFRNMTFRAKTIGASLDIQSGPSGGTLIRCTKNLAGEN